MHRCVAILLLASSSPLPLLALEPDAPLVSVELRVDGPDGKPMPCRVHLADITGRPHQPPGLPFWKDHFVFDGRVNLKLPSGQFKYEIERGPEWKRISGNLDVPARGDQRVHVRLERLAELRNAGLYSGDLHVHRPVEDIELLMRAEDLHVAP